MLSARMEAMTNGAAEPLMVTQWTVRSLRDLRRDPEHSVFAGVCAGIAKQSGYDVLIVRTLFVLLATAAGIGIAIYLLLAASSPMGSTEAPLDRYLPSWRSLDDTALLAILIACSALIALVVGIFNPLSIGTLLIVVGATGLTLATRAQAAAQLRLLPPPVLEEMSTLLSPQAKAVNWAPPSAIEGPIRPWAKRLFSGVITGILAVATWLTVSTLVQHENIMLISYSAALLVVGMGMILTARHGRSLLLLVGGIILTLLIIYSSINKAGIFANFQAPEKHYTAASALPSHWDYRDDAIALKLTGASLNGDINPEIRTQGTLMRLDLADLKLDRDQEIMLNTQGSFLQIVLPTDVEVVLAGDTRLTIITVDGERLPLFQTNPEWSRPGSAGQPVLTLNLDTRVSLIEVVT